MPDQSDTATAPPSRFQKAVFYVAEMIHEDADLQNLVIELTKERLGEYDPPTDGLYWETYTLLMTKILTRVATYYEV
jgi:hypothetical protein